MKQLVLSLVLILAGPASVLANTITAKINGMVCAFCAQGIEKKFKSEDSVKDVKVDLDAKTVKIDLKTGAKMSIEKIKKIIVGAGYEVQSIDGTSPNKVADSEPN